MEAIVSHAQGRRLMPSVITLSLEEKLRNSSDRTAGRGFGLQVDDLSGSRVVC